MFVEMTFHTVVNTKPCMAMRTNAQKPGVIPATGFAVPYGSTAFPRVNFALELCSHSNTCSTRSIHVLPSSEIIIALEQFPQLAKLAQFAQFVRLDQITLAEHYTDEHMHEK